MLHNGLPIWIFKLDALFLQEQKNGLSLGASNTALDNIHGSERDVPISQVTHLLGEGLGIVKLWKHGLESIHLTMVQGMLSDICIWGNMLLECSSPSSTMYRVLLV